MDGEPHLLPRCLHALPSAVSSLVPPPTVATTASEPINLLKEEARRACRELVREPETRGVERVAARVLEQVLETRRVNVHVALHDGRELGRVRVGTKDGAKVGVDHALHRGLELAVDVYELVHELVVLAPPVVVATAASATRLTTTLSLAVAY